MHAKFLFAFLVSSLVSFTNGAAVDARAKLDVFVPRIITPNARTTWVIGKVETVTWDTSNAPVNISNGAAVSLNNAAGPLSPWLVEGFNLRSGSVQVTVPTVEPGRYTITLFGDSGNRSPAFKVVLPN